MSNTSYLKLLSIAIALGVVGLLLTLSYWRLPVASWWWNTTHSLPELVIFVGQDAWFGASVAYYYFDAGDQQEEYDIARANRLYDQVIAIDPTIAWPWYQKGRIAFLYKDYEQSLWYLEKFQTLADRPRPRAMYLKGVVQGFAGDTEAALVSLKEYYAIDQESWYIYNNLAWVYFQLGQFNDMNEISATGVALHPENAWLLMNRSLALYNLGEVEQAKKYINRSYNEAIKLTEANWSATYPGNDPLIAQMGLDELLSIVEANKNLINKVE